MLHKDKSESEQKKYFEKENKEKFVLTKDDLVPLTFMKRKFARFSRNRC